MKKLGDFKKGVWIGLCVFLIVSCEQPDGVAEFINTNEPRSLSIQAYKI